MKISRPIIALLISLSLIMSGCGLQSTTPATGTQQTQSTITQPAQQKVFVGSINSDKYHYPSCRWAGKIKSENLVSFSSASEAKKAGYSPCQTCMPPSQ